MMFAGMNSGFEVTKALETESVMEFDHAITRVCHGFQTVEDYYTSCSSQGVLGNIQVPVLFLQVLQKMNSYVLCSILDSSTQNFLFRIQMIL